MKKSLESDLILPVKTFANADKMIPFHQTVASTKMGVKVGTMAVTEPGTLATLTG